MRVQLLAISVAAVTFLTGITPGQAAPPRQHLARGTLDKIDCSERTMTIKPLSNEQPMVFVWNDHTRFKNLSCCAGCNLATAGTVRVRYRREVGRNVLREVISKGTPAECAHRTK